MNLLKVCNRHHLFWNRLLPVKLVEIDELIWEIQKLREKKWFPNQSSRKKSNTSKDDKEEDEKEETRKETQKGDWRRGNTHTKFTLLNNRNPNQPPHRPARKPPQPVTAAMHGKRIKARVVVVFQSAQQWRRQPDPSGRRRVGVREVGALGQPGVEALE